MKSEFTFLVSPRTWQSGYRGRTSAIPLMLITIRILNQNWGNNRQTALSNIEMGPRANPLSGVHFFSLFTSFQQVTLYF
jgi:hypothetical protein